jgi:hypothetical protein
VLGECFIDAVDAGTVAVANVPEPQAVNLLSRALQSVTPAPFLLLTSVRGQIEPEGGLLADASGEISVLGEWMVHHQT